MSLQGTLDTFALPDVLRLLAGTRKTGHLNLVGSRGSGDLWLDSGAVVAAEASNARAQASAIVVLFELLRYDDGSFTFDNDMTTSGSGSPADVEPLLREAEILLEEWRTIEAVVPSTAASVFLRPELPHQTVSVSAEQWRTLVAVGGGTTVAAIGDAFELGELDVCRSVKGLVEAGLLEVGDPPGGGGSQERVESPAVVEPQVESAAEPEVEVEPEVEPQVEPEVGVEVEAASGPAPVVAAAQGHRPDREPVDTLSELASLAVAAPLTEAPEIARQLAQLGPEAARAVAVAASAETSEERDAALDTIDDQVDGEPINRGLLLKFLSSVRS